jgi:ATP-binding cassette subfamily F protein uup
VGELSGGERARLCLARLLAQKINLLLLDEPTNDLDVSALAALESMLVDYGGSAIVVSHDRWFLDRVATSILAFEGDGRVELHAGNYSEYRERTLARRREASQATERPRAATPRKAKESSGDGPKKLSYKEGRELDGMLDVIEAAENETSLLEARLADPSTYKDERRSGDIAELKSQLEAAHARVAQLTERWEALEARREATE